MNLSTSAGTFGQIYIDDFFFHTIQKFSNLQIMYNKRNVLTA